MAAKETKSEAVVTEKPTTRDATSRKAAAPEITQEMIAERAYHISQSGEGGADEENWHRAEAELRQGS
jgi:Protein of unknown function (DUF2934)